MEESVIIVDFGSQYTQLIARRVRELKVYSEIVPFTDIPKLDEERIKGVILSGSPASALEDGAPQIDLDKILNKKPVLAICYGAQYLAHHLGGLVERSNKREYGRAHLQMSGHDHPVTAHLPEGSQVWMSHGDSIVSLPEHFELIAKTEDIDVAAFASRKGSFECPIVGLQFHPEVTHSEDGLELFRNFLFEICGCKGEWTPLSFIEETVEDLRKQIGKEDKVILGLSGGVDSTVAGNLLHEAIGDQLTCIFVDNGLLRLNEFEEVLEAYKGMGLHVIGVQAEQEFLSELKGVEDPETKRKIIGRVFIEVFEREANKIPGVKWLAQGTIYPDVIESVSVKGPSATIKSHHNVGGLPDRLNLKIVEPLKYLFKDEVRKVGIALGIGDSFIGRHPFPGPGLAIRIISDVDEEKLRILKEADHIYIGNLKRFGLYDQVWQAGTILLPVKSVGVMGDERTYENVVALRAVTSTDGMTADWSHFPHEFLAKTSNEIINKVKGVNRVVYDISSKPPATIEWE